MFSSLLFKCDWVDNKGGLRIDELGHTLVDLKRIGHKSDPFILASQAKQVYYVPDQVDPRWTVTMDDDTPSTNKTKIKEFTKINGKIVVESIIDGIPYGPGANALLKDLSKLARSKEHDGRVRGMGKFVTPSNYFHTPNPQAQWNKEKKVLESRITYLEERMNAFVQRSLPDKTHIESHVEAQSSNRTPMMSSQMKAQDGDSLAMEKLAASQKMNPLFGEKRALSKGQPCKMTIGSLENIVTIETIIEMKSLLCLVSIDIVINEDAMLPIPNEVEGLLYLKDAIVMGREHVRVPFEDDIFANSCYCYIGSNDLQSLIEMKVLGGNHLLLCVR
ncbi:hypothetical protein Dsin_001337 [Dipteronia sinensis]|uniref:DUF4216 domain-containing protein n=1 Tax=Dipteronia sinensis TaxID=43782 RepID=A0AAE0B469_9ROSI|nr:hypothetical protein Dsin_001337 [Dipteronia sinensis]